MRVAREEFTVVGDAGAGEVNLLVAGVRVAFTKDEARRLADRLGEAIEQAAVPEPAALPGPTAFGFEARDLLALTQAIAGLRQNAAQAPAEITVAPSEPKLPATLDERKPNGRLRTLLKVLGKDDRDALPKRA